MKEKLVAIALTTVLTSCGDDCHDGVNVQCTPLPAHQEIIDLTIKILPEMLNKKIFCTDLYIYYTTEETEKFYELMYSHGYKNDPLGLCRRHNDHKRIDMLGNFHTYRAFCGVLVHELCHAVGYHHGNKMDDAVSDVYSAVINEMKAMEEESEP